MKNLKLLLSYAYQKRFMYALALFFTIISQIIVAAQPQLIRITIDSVLGQCPLPTGIIGSLVGLFNNHLHGTKGLLIMAAFIVLFSLLRGLFTLARINISSLATESSIKTLRNRIYNHIQLLPFSYHDSAKTGDLIQRCTSDIENVRLTLYSQMMDTISAFFLIGYSIYLMITLNVKLTLISLTIMPLTLCFSILFFKKMQTQFKKAAEYEAVMTTAVQENLTGIRVVKAFMQHAYEIETFTQKSKDYRDKALKINTMFAAFMSFLDFLSLAQIFTIIIYGSFIAYNGELTQGSLVAFISYAALLISPVNALGRILSNIGRALVSIERIESILNENCEALFPTNEKPVIKGDITFTSVSFAYPNTNKKVLDNISLTIKEGQTVAILGATGSGKSSLVNLLARLYEYNSGSIKINGIELNTIDKGWIRAQIGLILQEPFLYGKTIMENLKLSNPDIDDSFVKHYAKIASFDNEASGFEKGYETMVGERGVSLSGGQKQRLSIARTLIKNAPILIFDDSLSAVDSKTDINIREALKKEKGNKTMIIISHRISTICDADNIFVLEDGKIKTQGTHFELLAKDGLYKRIYDIQASAVKNESVK